MIRRNRHITHRPEYFTLNPCHDLAQGLVFAGLGRFPGGYRYDDATESMWGGGNHGTLTNMDPASDWVYVPELGRWALDFDGSNDHVVLQPISAGSGLTLACWVSTTQTTEGNWIRRDGPTIGAGRQIVLIGNQNSSTVRAQIVVLGIEVRVTHDTGGAFRDGTWQHWSATFTPTRTELYWNGVLVASGGGLPMPDTNSPWYLGCQGQVSPTSYLFRGRMCDPAIYDRALSASEIARLADPSNVMLDGLLVAPGRHSFPSAALTASPWIYYQSLRSYL